MATLHLVCGPPGSGKSTLARKLAFESSAVRLCADDWMISAGIPITDAAVRETIERTQWELAQRFLNDGRDVVIEWGSWGRDERLTILDHAAAVGHAVRGYFLMPPTDVLLTRIQARNPTLPAEFQVAPDVVVDGARRFQEPLPDELARYAGVHIERGSGD